MNAYKKQKDEIMGEADGLALTIADLPIDPSLKAFLELEQKLQPRRHDKPWAFFL